MDVTTAVNHALTRIQEQHRFTDTQLADHLEIDPVTLWRWKKGDVGRGTAILIRLLIDCFEGVSDEHPLMHECNIAA